ncbi:MAG: TonB-dependent receptor [Sphingomonadales bacterium]|nr:TonB-dependent receptor [Sphingomonadales bacterium]
MDTVGEIVVTAQKRQQNQQDVPISMTAVTPQALTANRITSVVDLNAVVPNLAVRPTAGGGMLPSFTMRGITSYGVVPGSDKEVSVYIDGVYISAPVGSSLDLPDIAQIEVLRGPQGTLFGRNATVGAVSVITRDPPGRFGVDQEFTYGNYKQFRSKTRIDTGAIGDFSASISFVHDQRRGDMKNLGAGTTFTFPASSGMPTTLVSPKYLGDKNQNSVFVAVKYEHGDFKVVNKFDWTENNYTPPGAAVVAVNPSPLALGPAGAGFLGLVLATQTTAPNYVTDGQRPDAVNNAFTLPSYVRNWGDSVTAEWRASDHLSFKNVFAFRSSYVRASNQIDGLGGIVVTPALASFIPAFSPIVGSPFAVLAIQQITRSDQWSDELQANYNARLLTLTAGLMYFHDKGTGGGPPGLPNNLALEAIPFGNFGFLGAAPARAHYAETSLAAYGQAEVHVLPQLDLVGGLRVTNDKRTGSYYTDGTSIVYAPYNATRPSFTVGANYKPSRDVLLYAKYSTAFVAGGSSGTVTYNPEKAYSWEAGIKSDWLDHRLRLNLAAFTVKYTDVQTSQSGVNVGVPQIALVVSDLYDLRARGFEFEGTFVPANGLTLSASLGYTDEHFLRIIPQAVPIAPLGVPINLTNFLPTLQPKWTADLSARYETPPVLGNARMTFQINAAWRDKELTDGYAVYQAVPQFTSVTYAPATWLINGRIALEHIDLPIGQGEIAVWAKNLTNDRSITFPDILGGFVAGTEFQQARTFGIDVNFKF